MRVIFLGMMLVFVAYAGSAQGQDWPRFGWDIAGSSAPSVSMGIDAQNVGSLVRQQVRIDGTVDSSAIYLHGVIAEKAPHDVFFVTTTYGKTIAIDADRGAVLWEFTPPGYGSFAGTYRITNATPVADSDRRFIYAAAPDGIIRKLSIDDGRPVWATTITKLPEREKIASPLSLFKGRVIAATDGYIGDAPPYQGHVAILDSTSGTLLHVWNSLGSDTHELMDPASYPQSDSGIWGRAGVVVDSDGDLYLSTGNGLWDGKVNWGDAVVELDPDATRILGNYTPIETEQLDEDDQDLGSASPALLGGGLIAQGGKDGWIRLLDWNLLQGKSPHRGGEIDRVPTPSRDRLFSALAVARIDSRIWVFAADNGGTSTWMLDGKALRLQWRNDFGGTSPLVVDDLEFVYDPRGGLKVYEATSGRLLTTLACGGGHWNSPIVVDRRIALPEGNANRHETSGVIDIWRFR